MHVYQDNEYSSSSEDEDDPFYTYINERSMHWNAEKKHILQQRIKHLPNLDSMNKGSHFVFRINQHLIIVIYLSRTEIHFYKL